MIPKPYYRIYRPYSINVSQPDRSSIPYTEDKRYCNDRIQLIRMYRLLQMQVIDTFQYVEPVNDNESTYSMRYHQLYGNLCAEIETNFRGILKANNYNVGDEDGWNIKKDFFKVNRALKLNDYEIQSSLYEISNMDISTKKKYGVWNLSTYTPLDWYKEHNSVKHYRSGEFSKANLKNVVTALGGLYILLYAQFGYLVDTISDENTLMCTTESGDEIVISSNDMGFKLHQKPQWQETDKYDFKWDTIKNAGPFKAYPFQ